MKIAPFKMRVTPEQSKRVQELLFKNGYKWFATVGPESQEVDKISSPYLFFDMGEGERVPSLTHLTIDNSERYNRRYFEGNKNHELMYFNFIKLYDK